MDGKAATQESLVAPDSSTPLILDVLPFKGRTLKFRHPFTVFPSFDETMNVYEAEISQFGISAWGATLDELRYDLVDEIHFAWRVYASAKDEKMTPGAQRLKEQLRSQLEEVW